MNAEQYRTLAAELNARARNWLSAARVHSANAAQALKAGDLAAEVEARREAERCLDQSDALGVEAEEAIGTYKALRACADACRVVDELVSAGSL